ncbi:nudC domain-containing protein 3 [Callorhinchus milii]|uniref:nudC domain-containing protein 3 n=1 Tax=Callorhinchus milii TaxID=7868 RepID=UPI0004575B2E|nr:nudC domain-containing protein 3 [Callorhinchus milii]|eukprot:gi/632977859/ref/XP_007905582.1/ PREDICTED: nudC domain-containing protein 3 [Callorhinchus milii]
MDGPPEVTEMYDQALLGILQHAGRVENFLEAMFGFLYRKTDFYRLQLLREDRLGFPPGGAARIALQAFKKYEHYAIQDHERRMKDLEEKLKKKTKMEEERTSVPPSIQEVEVGSTGEETPGAAAAEAAGEETVGASAQPAVSSDIPAEQPGGATALDVKQEPTEPPEKLSVTQENADSYNGAVRDTYTWSQDYTDLEVKVPVSKSTVKGKQVSVDIQNSYLRVAVFEGASERVLMDGKLTHKVNTENSLWSLEPGKCISISLNKNGEYWWNAILEGEDTIDIEKINKERSMATVDEEEHAVLDRLTFDYHQKMQGKPQSHEMKVHEMLKKGWDAEGSPFKGQKFDPTMFNISPGAVQF